MKTLKKFYLFLLLLAVILTNISAKANELTTQIFTGAIKQWNISFKI